MRAIVTDGWCWRDIAARDYGMVEQFPTSAGAVIGWARELGAGIVWLASSAALDAAIACPTWWADSETVTASGAIACALAHANGHIACRLMRSDDPRWGIDDRRIAPLAQSLSDLTGVLGRAPSISPASFGLFALRATLAPRGWLEPSPWTHQTAPTLMTRDIAYLNRAATPRAWLHIVDRNSAYLAMARASDLGTGAPIHRVTDRWDSAAFGIWHICEWSLPPALAPLVPLPTVRPTAWVATPVCAWLDELGVPFTVREVWEWPAKHRLLRPWAEPIVAARTAPLADDARTMAKRMINQTIGRLGHAPEGDVPWSYRPEWRAHIVAASAVTFARTFRRVEAAGATVLAAYTDMLAILSDDPDPPPCVPISTSIGHYKIVQSFGAPRTGPIGRVHELVRLAADPNVPIRDWLEVLYARHS